MVHMNILKKCGGELENALGSRCIGPCFTEEYIKEVEEIVTRTKIGRKCKKFDIKSPNKPFIKKHKPREPFKPNKANNTDQRKYHKCDCIGQLSNNFLKKEKLMKMRKQKTTMITNMYLILKKTLKGHKVLKVMKSL
ncbi:hypothetical protein O181_006899 [Austropuccinia psidii MF-1]|uniref:Uncharacterized protein n=1 Tax=Austropuccinia psidii MF-1 TaxID=1389203 RepID=A0A9Q3GHC1_9BASI|nr:hypothetical protein [Austropuccinia psidii MF-1]